MPGILFPPQTTNAPPTSQSLGLNGGASPQGLQYALNSGVEANTRQANTPIPQQQPSADTPHPIRNYLSNWLYNIGESAKAQAGIPTDFEQQNAAYKNQLEQAQTGLINKQAGNLDTVPFDLGNGQTIQVPKNAIGALAGRITSSQNTLEGKYAGINAQLNKMGLRLNDNNQLEVIPRGELSPTQQSQLDATQAATGLKNAQAELAQAKAIGEPQKIAIAQKKAAAYQQIANAASQNANTGVGKLTLAQQEFQAKYGVSKNPDGSMQVGSEYARLNPHAQQVLMETNPVKSQIQDLMAKLEPLKDNNTMGYLAADRLKYAAGIASDEGSLADEISKIELSRVVAGARILKGSSRAYQALQLAMTHAPNSWKDSPKLMYSKLNTILQNLTDVEQDAVKYGNKQGIVPTKSDGSIQVIRDANGRISGIK